jgi:hypothetical protein
MAKKRIKKTEPSAKPVNTPDQEDVLAKLRDWLFVDKAAKRFYLDEMREMYKLYRGDHWDLIGPGGKTLRSPEEQKDRPNPVENMCFPLVEGNASEFAKDVEITDYALDPADEEAADLLTAVKKSILEKNKFRDERVKFLRNYFLYGTGIWHVYWDPEWSGGRGPNRWQGDIRWRALHPALLFPDARCKESINEGNRCHKITWRTIESVRDEYPGLADAIQPEIMSEDELVEDEADSIPGAYYSRTAFSRDRMVPEIETWYIGHPLYLAKGEKDEGIGLHVVWWCGEFQTIFLRHQNYIYFDPGETPSFPFIVRNCYPRESSIWGFGEAYFLKAPQIIMNKTAEMILEGHLHSYIGQTWANESAFAPKQRAEFKAKGTIPGMVFFVKDINQIKRQVSGNMPATLQGEMVRLRTVMESIIGRYDVTQGKKPGSVTAAKAIEGLIERNMVRLKIKAETITGSYQEAAKFCNRLIEQFYGRRAFHYLDRLGDAANVLPQQAGQAPQPGQAVNSHIFDINQVKKVYHYDTGEVTPFYQGSHTTKDESDYEVYFPEFEVACKVTSPLPTDRQFQMELAKELLMGGFIGIETLYYTIQNGHLPPLEVLAKKARQKEQQMAAMQQQQTQGATPGAPPPALAAGGAPVPAQPRRSRHSKGKRIARRMQQPGAMGGGY